MLLGLRALGFDALNIGFPDLPGVGELGSALQGLPVTSANLRVRSPVEAFAPTTHLLVERDGLEVGFVGISRTSGDLPAPPSFDVAAPYESARNALRELSGRADLVVLLAFGAPSEARRLAEENAEIDVVIDTFQHRETGAAFRVGQAVWVRAPYEMQRLGELRLWLRDGRVVAALDRQIDMDPEIPDHPELSALQREARQAVRAKQIEIFGP
jgi:2',3'-cyclic-nucleotide 2'-phosphodiesterase (5'-nucleotidase family)